MYYRYFKVTSGPLLEELTRMKAINDENAAGYGAIATDLGVSQWMMFGTCFGGFIFDTPPDSKVWRQVQNYSKVFAPRKNVTAGKELWKRISAVVRKVDYNDALKVIDVSRSWLCVDHNRMTTAALCAGLIGESTIFIRVPWRDVDPEKLAAYKAQRELPKDQRTTWDEELEHLLWTPHPSMVEVKEWEMLKWKDENHKNLPEGDDDN